MTSEPLEPGAISPLGDDPLYSVGDANAEARLAQPRPQTGDEGTAARWWQVLVGIAGWLLALVLIWYFSRAADDLAWALLATMVTLAVLVGFGSALFGVNVLRPRLIARRDEKLPVEGPGPHDRDALGRPIATTEGAFRTATGELVAVVTPEGRQFLPPALAAPFLQATLEARRG